MTGAVAGSYGGLRAGCGAVMRCAAGFCPGTVVNGGAQAQAMEGARGRPALDASAQVTELSADDHACLTFGEAEELFDLTAAFVRDGLAAGLKVVWVSDAAPAQAIAELGRRGIAVRRAMEGGQMAAAGCEGRLLSGQEFRADVAV